MKIIIYSDYVCPWCYIAKPAFEKAIEGKNIEVDIRSYELRPVINGQIPPSPPLDRKKRDWERVLYPTCRRLGLDDMKMPEIDPEPLTYYAHEGMYAARASGLSVEYHKAVLKAYFEDGKDIGQIAVLADIAEKIGLDRLKFSEALENRSYSHMRQKDLAEAYRTVRAVPTFIIGNRGIEGFATEADFARLIDEAAAKK